MKVSRNVILDLLPLYLEGEVSADTRALVEQYLDGDPEFARIVQETEKDLPGDIPVPLTQEDKMKTYLQIKRLAFWRTIIVATLISFLILALAGGALLTMTRLIR